MDINFYFYMIVDCCLLEDIGFYYNFVGFLFEIINY